MSISFESIASECATFIASSVLTEGEVCKMSSSRCVSRCLDADAFIGVVQKVHGDYVSVAFHGFVTVPYSGTVPTCGYCALAADGKGKVKTLEGAREYLVVNVDTINKTVCFLL